MTFAAFGFIFCHSFTKLFHLQQNNCGITSLPITLITPFPTQRKSSDFAAKMLFSTEDITKPDHRKKERGMAGEFEEGVVSVSVSIALLQTQPQQADFTSICRQD